MGDLLVVDDEPVLALGLSRFFAKAGHEVRVAATGAEALAAFRERRPDVVLLDVNLPDMSGFDVFDALRPEEPVVVMISGHAEVPMAVRAVQAGAETLLTKPVDLAHLGVTVSRALERSRDRELARKATARRVATGEAALGTSAAMRDLSAQVDLLASSERTPVLIIGEPGTGKGRVAGMIHARSARRAAPFAPVHCRASSVEALDGELFGPAGDAGRPGLVEVVAGGTLFLDEVSELPAALQPRLLRLLEGNVVRRTGSAQEVAVDVRVIAATSRELIADVATRRFREDLHYQLAVMPLRLPPLREREPEDLAALVERLLEELAPGFPHSPRRMSPEAMDRLLQHAWPGNIRELRNVLERAMLLSRGAEVVGEGALPPDLGAREGEPGVAGPPRTLDAVEREHVARALQWYGDNRSHAARALGISRATLIKKIKAWGLGARPADPRRGRMS